MRQAYDYWQNQPGNYREDTRGPRRSPGPDPPAATPGGAQRRGTEVAMYPRRDRGPRTVQKPARPGTLIDPPRGGDRPEAIQLPPLNSSRTGPPQELVRQAARPTTPRLQHAVLKRRIPRSPSRRPVGRRLRTAAYPQKSGKNLSQGPIIHRPHPHREHAGLSGVSGTFSPTPRGGGADSPARGHRLSRNAPQHVRPEESGRSSTKPYGPPRLWWWKRVGGPPGLSALLKGPARRRGTGTTDASKPPAVLPRGTATRGGGTQSTHCTNAGGQQDGRGGGTAGVVDPEHRRDISLSKRCTGEITVDTHPRRPTA